MSSSGDERRRPSSDGENSESRQEMEFEDSEGDNGSEQHEKEEDLNNEEETAKAQEARENARKQAQDPELRRALRKGIPLQFAIQSIDRKVQGKELMRDFVVYVPFFILFVVFFVAGQTVGPGYWLAASMRDLLTGNEFPNTPPRGNIGEGPYWAKGFFDIAESSDWYTWIQGVAVFYLWDNPRGPDAPNVPINFGTGNNHLLGSARVRTLRVTEESCESNQYVFGDIFPNPPWSDCYAVFSSSTNSHLRYGALDTEDDVIPWEFQDCSIATGAGLRGKVMGYPCGGHVIDIPFDLSHNEALDIAFDLQERGFVDDQHTRLVSFELYTYAPVLNIFTNCKYFVEVTTGGSWVPFAKCRNFEVWTTANAAGTALEGLFFFYVFYFWVKFFIDWRRDWKKQGGKWLPYILSLWSILEFVNLGTFTVVFAVRFLWLSKSRGLEFTFPVVGYPGELDQVNSLYQLAVYLNALNTIITCLKILKFVRLNDRLNILTRTLETAQQNIFGILLIFLVIITGFAVTGTSLYGNALEDFKDFNTSLSSLLRILVGDFDYPAMRDENRQLTAIYFWAWVIIGLFLMLNFIIAVISEAFSKENDKTKASPLEKTFYKFWKQMKRNFKRNPCNGILAKLKRRMKKLRERVVLQYLYKYRMTLLYRLKARKRAGLEVDRFDDVTQLEKSKSKDGSDISSSDISIEEDDDDDDDMDDEKLLKLVNPTLFHSEIGRWLPISEKRELGADYLDEIWEDLVDDYELQNRDEEEIQRKKKIETIQSAAYTVVTQLMVAAGLIDAPQEDNDEAATKLETLLQGRQGFLQMITPNQLSAASIATIDKTLGHIETQLATIARVLCIVDARMSLLRKHVGEGVVQLKTKAEAEADKMLDVSSDSSSAHDDTHNRDDSESDVDLVRYSSSTAGDLKGFRTSSRSTLTRPPTMLANMKPQMSFVSSVSQKSLRSQRHKKEVAGATQSGPMDSFAGIDPTIYSAMFSQDTALPEIKPVIQPRGADTVVYIPPTNRYDITPGAGANPM